MKICWGEGGGGRGKRRENVAAASRKGAAYVRREKYRARRCVAYPPSTITSTFFSLSSLPTTLQSFRSPPPSPFPPIFSCIFFSSYFSSFILLPSLVAEHRRRENFIHRNARDVKIYNSSADFFLFFWHVRRSLG